MVELYPQESPGEIKKREVELDSHSWLVRLAAELFLNSCFSDTVFVTEFSGLAALWAYLEMKRLKASLFVRGEMRTIKITAYQN